MVLTQDDTSGLDGFNDLYASYLQTLMEAESTLDICEAVQEENALEVSVVEVNGGRGDVELEDTVPEEDDGRAPIESVFNYQEYIQAASAFQEQMAEIAVRENEFFGDARQAEVCRLVKLEHNREKLYIRRHSRQASINDIF